MASADGLSRLAGLIKAVKLRRIVVASLSFIILFLNLYLLPAFPLWKLTKTDYWHRTQSDKDGYDALSIIPRDASVTAQANIVPHLSHRRNLFLIRPVLFVPDSEYIVASSQLGPYPFPAYKDIEDYLSSRQEDYSTVFDRGGWVVLKRKQAVQNRETTIPIKEDADINEIVSAIYVQVLGREPDNGGHAIWSEYIRQHRASTKTVIKQFALSDEFLMMLERQESKETAVRLIYRRLLAREPDANEIAKSMSTADSRGLRTLILNLLNSAEYDKKFGECSVPGEPVITDKRCLELQE